MKFNPFKSLAPATDDIQQGVTNFDESVLQQGRFWMRTVTWTLIGTTVFANLTFQMFAYRIMTGSCWCRSRILDSGRLDGQRDGYT